MRESNPRLDLGKVLRYRYANPAQKFSSLGGLLHTARCPTTSACFINE